MKLRKFLALCLLLCLSFVLVLPSQAKAPRAKKLPAPEIDNTEVTYINSEGTYCVAVYLNIAALHIASSFGHATGDFETDGIAIRIYSLKDGKPTMLQYPQDYPDDSRIGSDRWIRISHYTPGLTGKLYNGADDIYKASFCGVSSQQTIVMRFAGTKINGKLGQRTDRIRIELTA